MFVPRIAYTAPIKKERNVKHKYSNVKTHRQASKKQLNQNYYKKSLNAALFFHESLPDVPDCIINTITDYITDNISEKNTLNNTCCHIL